MYLLDTNVVGALRRPDKDPAPILWLQSQKSSDLYLSVITLGEIEKGIAKQVRLNPPFAGALSVWFDNISTTFADRILPVDASIARRWGRLSDQIGNDNADLFIAATALEHELTVVTRNVRHFEPTGVGVIDPYVFRYN